MSTGNVGGAGAAGGATPTPPSGADLSGPPPARSFDSVMRDRTPNQEEPKADEKGDPKKPETGEKSAKGAEKRPKTLEEFRAMRAQEKGRDSESGKSDEDLALRGVPHPATQKPLDVRRPAESRSELRVEGAGLSKEAMEKIVDKVRIGVNRAGATEMQFDLKGDVLGGLGMKVSTIDGRVFATFVADSPGVKEMLDRNVAELEKALRDRGLAIGEIKVDLRRGDLPDRERRQQEQQEEAWGDDGGEA